MQVYLASYGKFYRPFGLIESQPSLRAIRRERRSEGLDFPRSRGTAIHVTRTVSDIPVWAGQVNQEFVSLSRAVEPLLG